MAAVASLTRSIYWEKEYLEPTAKFFQPAWVVNYPEADVDWTRISEYKHSPNQPAGVKDHPGTVVYREYSTDQGDPYYPVPNKRNRDLYAKYQVTLYKAFISWISDLLARLYPRKRKVSSLLVVLPATSISTWTRQY